MIELVVVVTARLHVTLPSGVTKVCTGTRHRGLPDLTERGSEARSTVPLPMIGAHNRP